MLPPIISYGVVFAVVFVPSTCDCGSRVNEDSWRVVPEPIRAVLDCNLDFVLAPEVGDISIVPVGWWDPGVDRWIAAFDFVTADDALVFE